jgi:hypothetical protein
MSGGDSTRGPSSLTATAAEDDGSSAESLRVG